MMCSMTTTGNDFQAAKARLDAVLVEFASLDVDRALLEQFAAGPALVCLLAAIRPELLDADAQLSFIAAAERGNAWLVSVQQRGMVAFAGSTPRLTTYQGANGVGSIEDVRRTELAAELRWSEPLAHQKLTTARIVIRDLPQVARASERGVLPESRARALADGAARLVSRIDDAMVMSGDASMKAELHELRAGLLADFEQKLVSYAQTHDLASTRRKVRDTLATLDPAGTAARRAKAQRDLTDVTIRHDDDGMSTLTAVMPSEQAIVCLQAIDGLARSSSWADASLPIGVRRADALLTLLTQAARGSIHAEEARPSACECGAVHARPAVQLPRLPLQVNVTIDLGTFLGLNHEAASLDGVGPIPAQVVRALIAADPDARMRRLITDPLNGALSDVAARSYHIDSATRRLIEIRDQHCRFPGCTRPARRCECDHATAFGDGGATSVENLGLACRRHHQCKTHGGWTINVSSADGACTWVSPRGRAYTHEPLAVLPQPALRSISIAGLERSAAALNQQLLRQLADTDLASEYRQGPSAESHRALDALTVMRDQVSDLVYARHVLSGLHHGAGEAMLMRLLDRHHAAVTSAKAAPPTPPVAPAPAEEHDDKPPF